MDVSRPLRSSGERDFAALKARALRSGLLERQPLYYVGLGTLLFGLFAGAWLLALRVEGLAHQGLAALLLGLAYSQLGLLAHDAGHNQIFRSLRHNRWFAFFLLDAVLGLSCDWWIRKHDAHHAHPNAEGIDPDVAPVLVAWSADQARRIPPERHWFVRYQAWLLLPALLLEGFHLRLQSLRWVLRGASRHARAERAALALHYSLYAGLLGWGIGGWNALWFALVHHMAMGLYLGLVFAPNHVGMPIVRQPGRGGYLQRQLTATRNVRPPPALGFLFGGLDRQIEHHLFPRMARNQLPRARALVQTFCRERSIPYCELGLLAAYGSVLASLHRAGAPLRERRAAARPA